MNRPLPERRSALPLTTTLSCVRRPASLSSRGDGAWDRQRRQPMTGETRRSTLLPKRTNRSDEHSAFTNSERQLILAAETLRAGDTGPPQRSKEEAKSSDEKISLF